MSSAYLPRSSSIDSMVDAVWTETMSGSTSPTKRTSITSTGSGGRERPLSLVSPSVGRRMKGQRGINGK